MFMRESSQMKIIFALILAAMGGCLAGCQFSGGTALPDLPGLKVKTPSGWEIMTSANTKGSLKVKDGDREIDVKLTQDVSGVVESQAELAKGLEGLAKIETERQKAMWNSLGIIFDKLIERALPIPEPLPGPTP